MPEGDFVYFALKTEDYEKISTDRARITAWICQAMAQLLYYRNDTEDLINVCE